MDDVVPHVVLIVQPRALSGPYLSTAGRGAPEDRWQYKVTPLQGLKDADSPSKHSSTHR